MNINVLSVAHSLQLVDISKLAIFSRTGSQVILSWLPGPRAFSSIPGTIQISSSRTDKGYEKTITTKVVSEGYGLGDLLFAYSKRRLVAIYTDARGYMRVCGSPEHPLRLRYDISDGVANVTLTGTDSRDDAYLLVG